MALRGDLPGAALKNAWDSNLKLVFLCFYILYSVVQRDVYSTQSWSSYLKLLLVGYPVSTGARWSRSCCISEFGFDSSPITSCFILDNAVFLDLFCFMFCLSLGIFHPQVAPGLLSLFHLQHLLRPPRPSQLFCFQPVSPLGTPWISVAKATLGLLSGWGYQWHCLTPGILSWPKVGIHCWHSGSCH